MAGGGELGKGRVVLAEGTTCESWDLSKRGRKQSPVQWGPDSGTEMRDRLEKQAGLRRPGALQVMPGNLAFILWIRGAYGRVSGGVWCVMLKF